MFLGGECFYPVSKTRECRVPHFIDIIFLQVIDDIINTAKYFYCLLRHSQHLTFFKQQSAFLLLLNNLNSFKTDKIFIRNIFNCYLFTNISEKKRKSFCWRVKQFLIFSSFFFSFFLLSKKLFYVKFKSNKIFVFIFQTNNLIRKSFITHRFYWFIVIPFFFVGGRECKQTL